MPPTGIPKRSTNQARHVYSGHAPFMPIHSKCGPHIPPPRLMLKLPGHTFKLASRNASPTRPGTFSMIMHSGPDPSRNTLTHPGPNPMPELLGRDFKLVSQNASPTRPGVISVTTHSGPTFQESVHPHMRSRSQLHVQTSRTRLQAGVSKRLTNQA